MSKWQFHTPDGVSDLLPVQCREKRVLEGRLRQLFAKRGYAEIETPGIEFYDVFAAGSGAVPQEELFKFFDQQGRILCLRYDGTVPAARVAARLCQDVELPLRFSYINNMYRYAEFGGGRQREFGQAGIELIGSNSPAADAEVIATAIRAALACGIKDLQVSLGQVAFFHAVLAHWQISDEAARLLPHLIDTKQLVAIEELAEQLDLPDQARKVISKLASSQGSLADLAEYAKLVDHPQAKSALDNLSQVLQILAEEGYDRYVTVDLGMLQSINYYTGIIFKGFTYGLGFPLFSGGRYDGLLRDFGRDLPATGFSIGISLALAALQRQGLWRSEIKRPVFLGYARGKRQDALLLAEQMREQGQAVICDCDNLDLAELTKKEGPILYLDEKGARIWLKKEGKDATIDNSPG